jgi:2-polyprenyl-3-methyl-5-hydroxy-6-metoxy-1,4-benzoquinol methylase
MIHLVSYDVERGDGLPFHDEQFSVVSMLAVFEHIEIKRLVALLTDTRRILTPDGRLILTTPTKIAHSVLRAMAKIRLVSPIEIEEHKTCLYTAEILDVMAKAGFSSDHVTHGYFQCWLNQWLIAVKR